MLLLKSIDRRLHIASDSTGREIVLFGYSLGRLHGCGVDLYRVKELMGHSSIQTTMRYAHLAPDNLRNEVERVFG